MSLSLEIRSLEYIIRILCNLRFVLQVFTNADKEHVAQVLNRLGLEDCFEGVICFETLNPTTIKMDNFGDNQDHGANATDVIDFSNDSLTSKSRVICKPSLDAFEAAIRITNIDPEKTV